MLAFRTLLFLLFIAIFADFIANERPIFCKYKGSNYFPVFREYLVKTGFFNRSKVFKFQDWQSYEYDYAIMPLIPYSSNTQDKKNRGVGPFDDQDVPSLKHYHWLGTDKSKRDVLAGMISGTRTSLLIGFLSMGIATIIGLFLGAMAGYYGDHKFKISYRRFLANLLFIPLLFYWLFVSRSFQVSEGSLFNTTLTILTFVTIVYILNFFLSKIPAVNNNKISIPIDLIVMRLIEVLSTIPAIMFILVIAAIVKKQSIYYIILIFGFLMWKGIARFVRAELLRIRSLNYIEASEALGFSHFRILWKHAVPNALAPVFVIIAFGIAGVIIGESTLSFLGIGVGAEEVTWGSLLNEGRNNTSKWWLAIVPGLAIFTAVISFNMIADGLSEAINPTIKQ